MDWRSGLDMKRNVVICYLSMLLAPGMEQASIGTVTNSCTGAHLHHVCVCVCAYTWGPHVVYKYLCATERCKRDMTTICHGWL